MTCKYVLYHANCYDGFGAAWAARKAMGSCAEYIPMHYSSDLPEFRPNSEIFMVDYSRKAEDIFKLLEAGHSVTVIDHHKSADIELDKVRTAGKFENFNLVFNLDESGAVLTWKYFNDSKTPQLLLFIQDRDLWRFNFEATKAIHAGLCSYPFDFEVWDELADNVSALSRRGEAVLAYHDELTKRLCEQARLVDIGGYVVPMVNTSILFSEVPHLLLDLYPGCPFAAYRYERKDSIQYGLRSRKGEYFDVSIIAKEYGGGGHVNASGFEIKHKEGLEVI